MVSFSIVAVPNSGNLFNGWTATAGISIADSNAASTTAVATQAGTITASFASTGSPSPGGGGSSPVTATSSASSAVQQSSPSSHLQLPNLPPGLVVAVLVLVGIAAVFASAKEKRGSV